MPNRPLRVFLCHSSNDKPAVRELYQKLTELGIDAWLDEKKLLPGQNWEVEIPKAVKKSDAVIVCLSKKSITKEGYVQKEISFALDIAQEKPENTIYIIPAKIEECKLPERLGKFHSVNLFDTHGMDFLLESLKIRAKSLKIKFEAIQPVGQNFGLTAISKKSTKLKEQNLTQKLLKDFQKAYGKPLEEYKADKLTLSNGMEFMRIPAGKFIMGSNHGYKDEKPKHIVDIPYDYWMGRFPVTNEQYIDYLRTIGIKPFGWEKKSDHPVIRVSWDDATRYCRWLHDSIKFGLPNHLIIRLATEAEWEKAARSIDGREYPWGNIFDKNKCNSEEGGKEDTTPVGFYSPQGDSLYGCADMAGNVWEWVHSVKKHYPYSVSDGREDEKNFFLLHVLRGGSFNLANEYLRCARRYRINTNDVNSLIGFRVCLAPPLP